jgi:dipeptidyl aminopeptidase/acylaminoacyl peptidase
VRELTDNVHIMFQPFTRPATVALRGFFLLVLVSLAVAQNAAKRPLTVNDFDNWRNIQNQQLSPDGKFAVYALFPEAGDGQFVLRNLANGEEHRENIGARPPLPPPNFANPVAEEGPQEPRGITIAFTPDGKSVVFSTFPNKIDVDKAKKEHKAAGAMPKGGMVLMDLSTGAATRVAGVKNFQVPEDGKGWMAYLKEAEPAEAEPKPQTSSTETAGADRRSRTSEYGTPLVLRNLSDQTERTFADVTEFALSKDAKTLLYTVGSRKEADNGLFVFDIGESKEPRAILGGPGRYAKLAWDSDQKQLAFLSDRDEPGQAQPKLKLYRWDRKSGSSNELASTATQGFPKKFAISDKNPPTFSKDGKRVFFSTAVATPNSKTVDIAGDDKVSVDLWHWKDEHIQPMQKVRAETDRGRSYRAVLILPDKKVAQLSDETMPELTLNEEGTWALGGDDREYRPAMEYDQRYSDSYLVDTLTGARHLIAKKHTGQVTWSPNGKYALLFNGTDWNTISVPEGKTVNLTASLPVKFWTEDNDTPGTPQSYGTAGWTKDGKYVLLYDRFDVWQVTPDGRGATNLTDGAGRHDHLQLRYVKLDAKEKSIDPAKPLILRAENMDTHDSGFYTDRVDGNAPPRKLILSDRTFTPPVKAKNANVYLLTASTFNEYPDLVVTDSEFHDFRKISDANPQKSQFYWGTSELVKFRNADGIAVQGALYKPENFDPGKKYPMIVYIYERLSQNVQKFVDPRPTNSINISLYVSNGYLVFTPDIVYTIGYPGQSAMKSVLPGVQTIVDRGYVDENHIGIQGHSWGGYQIAYMITQTDRFRAAEAGAVVANMTSAYDGIRWGPGIPRQFQYERTQSRIGGSLWEFPMRYIENSPVFQADRVHTPLLMIHNDADDAVPWYQGIEYYLALRRLGKEVYMFSYNGEPHNLRRRANQKDFTLRMQQYFDYYLKGAPEPDWMKHGIPYLDREQEKIRFTTDASGQHVQAAGGANAP